MTRMLVPIPEAAHALGCGRSTVYELVKNGDLERVKLGRRALITAESLSEYVSRLTGGRRDA